MSSASNYYLDKGFTPAFRTTLVNSATTIAVWTPTTSTRVVLTDVQITSTAQSGTLAFYFGNLAGTKIFEFAIGTTSTISPAIGPIESTMYDREIFVKSTPGGDGLFRVNLQGFELP